MFLIYLEQKHALEKMLLIHFSRDDLSWKSFSERKFDSHFSQKNSFQTEFECFVREIIPFQLKPEP